MTTGFEAMNENRGSAAAIVDGPERSGVRRPNLTACRRNGRRCQRSKIDTAPTAHGETSVRGNRARADADRERHSRREAEPLPKPSERV
jgi:hypothetical protein